MRRYIKKVKHEKYLEIQNWTFIDIYKCPFLKFPGGL